MRILEQYFKENNYDESLIVKFRIYFDLLIEWNNKFNLTNITEKEEVEEKHFIDSLLAEKYILKNSTICDIGSGAGFPSIPLAIVRSDCKFTLVDSLNKRVNFLNEVVEKLELSNCECIHDRAEDYALKHLNQYDYCVARAVAPLPTLLEYTIPLLKINGSLLAYKGSNIDEEIDLSKNAFKVLKSKIKEKVDTCLPNKDYRCILNIVKEDKTPKGYPRGGNKPRIKPL